VLALSKADLMPEEEAHAARDEWAARLGEDVPVLVTSSATGQGLDALAGALVVRVPEAPPVVDEPDALAEHMTFRPAADRGFTVQRLEDGTFKVAGRGMDSLIGRYDLENDEALAHVEHTLERIGVVRALEEAGFEPGDDVEIGGIVFELHPGA
jgi:GTP-binding protein